MKTQEILTLVNAVVNQFGAELQNNTDVQKLVAGLEQQLRDDISKTTNCANAAKIVQTMLNKLKKTDAREKLHYQWKDENGRQCICDGYRAYRFNPGYHLPLEDRPDNVGKGIDLSQIIPDKIPKTCKSIPLPSAKDVKAFIALERAKNPKNNEIIYDLGFARPVVNAQYLLDIINIFPDAKEILYRAHIEGYMKPLIIRTERADAVLLPIRSPEKIEQFICEYSTSEEEKQKKLHDKVFEFLRLDKCNTSNPIVDANCFERAVSNVSVPK